MACLPASGRVGVAPGDRSRNVNPKAEVALPPGSVTTMAQGCELSVCPTLTGDSLGGKAIIAVATCVNSTVGARTIQGVRVTAGDNLDGRHAVFCVRATQRWGLRGVLIQMNLIEFY